jgi:hypothetical protein
MREFCPEDYGPVLARLVTGERCRALDAGRPDESMRVPLRQATVESAFASATVIDRSMAAACLAGAWLVHDFFDESHTVSQSIDTPTGAFWHGVMHRREGDYSNAKYWFRRVRRHETFAAIGEAVVALGDEFAQAELARRIAPGGEYDPMAMVDACQAAVRSGGPAADFLRRVQQAEWESLFDFCYRGAVGKDS